MAGCHAAGTRDISLAHARLRSMPAESPMDSLPNTSARSRNGICFVKRIGPPLLESDIHKRSPPPVPCDRMTHVFSGLFARGKANPFCQCYGIVDRIVQPSTLFFNSLLTHGRSIW